MVPLLLFLILLVLLFGPGAVLAMISATFWSVAGGIAITVSVASRWSNPDKSVEPFGWAAVWLLTTSGLFVLYSVIVTVGLPVAWLWVIAASGALCVNTNILEPYLLDALEKLNGFTGGNHVLKNTAAPKKKTGWFS